MIEHGALPGHLIAAADVLETRFEEVIAAYEERLLAIQSPLLGETKTREQVMAQARSVLAEVTVNLRGREVPPDVQQSAVRLSETIGASRASGSVHAFHSLRAVVAFSEAALSVLVENLPASQTSSIEVAAVAVAIQKSFTERVMRAAMAYADYLLEKAHESHADERRRISRELHDRVAHSIMVAFRSLEIFEMYKTKDLSKAQARLELAKGATQEALEVTRSLSRELRSGSAEEGLEVALTEFLDVNVPPAIRSRASVEGDESLVTPQVRDELFLILREGVRNAVTHSRAGTITIEVAINENQVEAAVEDDGRGFEPGEEATRASGAGLASMKERAALLGGTAGLMSTPGKGTRIEVFLPLLPRSRR
ncbi:MAG: histidine kinase [Actinobacteria bacterium]|nr:histidine kinase [Actinomycetota bacterium]